ncbi:MAG: AmmeMemoRadiSam system radical SAM enzyme [Deltaproteobacteria bacterium]
MKEAAYYETLPGMRVRCRLCPHGCDIAEGKAGLCGVRVNKSGRLMSANYGRAASVALDPIEKKPLMRFHPGEAILSVGTVGCNLGCSFCQNWSISKEVTTPTQSITAAELISTARKLGSFGIAYTYNEPFIWYEFVRETAQEARAAGLANVLVTNGYVALEPLEEILPYVDAANVDLKSIRDEFYRTMCGGRVAPVLETIRTMAAACHVELTNLIIPGANDSEEDIRALVDWIVRFLGPEVPLHFSRYFPAYKLTAAPTPVATLRMAEAIAREKLAYVYLGNI